MYVVNLEELKFMKWYKDSYIKYDLMIRNVFEIIKYVVCFDL